MHLKSYSQRAGRILKGFGVVHHPPSPVSTKCRTKTPQSAWELLSNRKIFLAPEQLSPWFQCLCPHKAFSNIWSRPSFLENVSLCLSITVRVCKHNESQLLLFNSSVFTFEKYLFSKWFNKTRQTEQSTTRCSTPLLTCPTIRSILFAKVSCPQTHTLCGTPYSN